MNLCLKTAVREPLPTVTKIVLSQRLPKWIESECELVCQYQVKTCGDYYLLDLKTSAVLPITCQRCLEIIQYNYDQETQLAVCVDDKRAEELMALFDCVVVEDTQLNLDDILIDDLYLYVPEIPHSREVCHFDLNHYLI